MLRKLNKWLPIILTLGLLLRIYGISYGFPFIYSVDEPALVRSAIGIRFNPNPEHFDWPHLHFYLNFLFYTVFYLFRGTFQVTGLRELAEGAAPILWKDPLVFYLISRIFNAVLGALTSIPIYLIGKKLFGVRAGLAAALALAVFPYHAWNSHFALIDVPMVFWFAWSVYFSVLIFKEGGLRNFLLAGIFAGLSASTKYNGGFAVLVILLAYLIRLNSFRQQFLLLSKQLVLAGLVAVLAFFVGTPFALLDNSTFLTSDTPKGALWQFENVGKVKASEYFPQLVEALTTKFDGDFGYTLLILFEVYVLYFLISKKTSERLFIVLPAVFYFLYVSSFGKNRVHYYMPIFPFIALMAGHFVELVYKLKPKILVAAFSLIVFAIPTCICLKDAVLLATPDTRNVAFDWMLANIRPGSSIFYSGGDIAEIMRKPFLVKRLSSAYQLKSPVKYDYYVVGTKGDISERDDYSVLAKTGNLVYSVKADGRLGPDIYIYEYKKQNPSVN